MKFDLAKKIILFCLLIILTSIFIYTWWGIFVPQNKHNDTQIIFKIERGENSVKIAKNLKEEGLIKNNLFFSLYLFLLGEHRNLKAGFYYVSPSENIPTIAKKFIGGDVAKIYVTIPEGFSTEQIEERLIEKKLIEESEIKNLNVEYFKNKFVFLNDIPSNHNNLEGFLFPDTYELSYSMGAKEIIERMLDNFDKKAFSQFKEEIGKQKKTVFEVITMASLIEKEVRTFEDKKIVSGILWKRLANRIPLQVDATVTYILGKRTTRISIEETKVDSPYNTYKYLGLPIGPICNPGLESILAALYPKDSGYWYYLSTPEGETKFNKTLEDHNRDKNTYLR